MTRIFIIALSFMWMLAAHAEEDTAIGDAIRIVVITGDEGIHYERGCAFYEFRALLAENERNASVVGDLSDDPLFEIRVIGQSGNSTIYVGNHWMTTPAGTTLIPSKAYKRIAALVEMRRGAGVPESKINMTIRKASKRIQGPNFVEDNRCAKQF